MQIQPAIVRCVLPTRCGTGESPVWNAEEQALYWVDIPGRAVHRFEAATSAHRRWSMPALPGCVALTDTPALLCGLQSGLHLFDPETGALQLLAHPEAAHPANRYNDGKVGPDGRFWVGSMDTRPQREPIGTLYRVDADGAVTPQVQGLRTPNGIAWSPDGAFMYLADTRALTVWRYPYDVRTGAIGPRTVFVEFAPDWGRPDGAAVDRDGAYWVCGFDAGWLHCFSPAGELLRSIRLPVTRPTMPCFGGPELRTLFITTARDGLTDAALSQQPWAGALLALDVDVPGLPVARFTTPVGSSR